MFLDRRSTTRTVAERRSFPGLRAAQTWLENLDAFRTRGFDTPQGWTRYKTGSGVYIDLSPDGRTAEVLSACSC